VRDPSEPLVPRMAERGGKVANPLGSAEATAQSSCCERCLDRACGCARPKDLSHLQRAVVLVRNAYHGRPPAPPTPWSMVARNVYHSWPYRLFCAGIALLNCIVGFFEPSREGLGNPAIWVPILEVFCLAVMFFDVVVQWVYLGTHVLLTKRWTVFKLACIPVMLVSMVAIYSTGQWRLAFVRLLRPVFLLERLRNVRRVAASILSATPRILSVLVLLGIFNILFSVAAFTLFAGIDNDNCTPFQGTNPPMQGCSVFLPPEDGGCTNYFSTLLESMTQLFELMTTATFPDIMIPVYRCSKLSAVFFVVFIVVNTYFLLNLTLAVTYSEFKFRTLNKVLERYSHIFQGLDLAWENLMALTREEEAAAASPTPPPGVKSVPRLQSPRAFEGISRSVWRRFFHELRHGTPEEVPDLLFDAIDGDKRGVVYLMEFRRMIMFFGRLRIRQQPTETTVNPTMAVKRRPVVARDESVASPAAATGTDDDEKRAVLPPGTPRVPPDAVEPRRPSLIMSVLQSATKFANERVALDEDDEDASGEGVPDWRPSRRLQSTKGAGREETAPVEFQCWPCGSGGCRCRDPVNDLSEEEEPAERRACARCRDTCCETCQCCSYMLCNRKSARDMLSRRWTYVVFDLAVALNAIFILVNLSQGSSSVSGPPVTTPTMEAVNILQNVTLAVFFFEVVVKVWAFGFCAYIRKTFNKFDLVLFAFSVAGVIAEVVTISRSSAFISSAISFFRTLRIIRLLRINSAYDTTIQAFLDIIPVLGQYLTVLIGMYYSFAVIGMSLFSGVLDQSIPAVALSSYGTNRWYEYHFDDLESALTSLFTLMVVNNWPILMEGCVAGTGTLWARAFFVVFYIVTVVLVLNVLVAFIIESFQLQQARSRSVESDPAPSTAHQSCWKKKDHEHPNTSRRSLERGMNGIGDRLRATSTVAIADARLVQQVRSGSNRWSNGLLNAQTGKEYEFLLKRAGVSLDRYFIKTKKTPFDIYDNLYREAIFAEFPSTFSDEWRDPTATPPPTAVPPSPPLRSRPELPPPPRRPVVKAPSEIEMTELAAASPPQVANAQP
jgi:hypothetical protein